VRFCNIPDLPRHRATLLGDSGERWLANLDELLSEAGEHWRLEIEAPLTGGTEALVFSVSRPDGPPAVPRRGPLSARSVSQRDWSME
jgi:hypothetical protein